MKYNTEIILENDLVRLEPLKNFHANFLLPIVLNEPHIMKYSPFKLNDKKGFRDYIVSAIKDKLNNIRYPFVIYSKRCNEFVGMTCFGNYSERDQRIEIGWTFLKKESLGKGINFNCKQLMMQYAFNELKVHRIEFKTDVRNQRSRKAIEKIGAKFEGKLRSHTLLPNGHRRDTAFYSILSSEWKVLKLEENKAPAKMSLLRKA